MTFDDHSKNEVSKLMVKNRYALESSSDQPDIQISQIYLLFVSHVDNVKKVKKSKTKRQNTKQKAKQNSNINI